MTSRPSPGVRRREPLPLRTLGLVASGAALGAVARFALQSVWPEYAVIAINIVGALLLGLATGRHAGRRPGVLAFAGTGFCGGFTTFSTVMVGMARADDTVRAFALMLLQLVGAVVAAHVGVLAATPRSAGESAPSERRRDEEPS